MKNQATLSNVINFPKLQDRSVSIMDPDPSSPGALAMPLPASEKEQEGDTCAFLALKQGNIYVHAVSIHGGSQVIGRDGLRLALNLPNEISQYISKHHCVISSRSMDGKTREYLIKNTSKTNGTYLNGKRLGSSNSDLISSGDQIQIGHLEFRFFEGGECWATGEC